VWDESNHADRAGNPCEWCAAWNRFVAAVEAEPESAPAPTPTGLDLSRVAGYVRLGSVLHIYDFGSAFQHDLPWANVPPSDHCAISRVVHHAADGRTIDAREAVPPPPAPAIPELPAGTTPTVPGFYVTYRKKSGTVIQYISEDGLIDCDANCSHWRFAGPIPLPSFANEGKREGGKP
jgi:hypothetical protein